METTLKKELIDLLNTIRIGQPMTKKHMEQADRLIGKINSDPPAESRAVGTHEQTKEVRDHKHTMELKGSHWVCCEPGCDYMHR